MFDTKDHLRVKVIVGELGSFRLGISLINGDDTLGTGASFSAVEFTQYCTEIQIDNGLTTNGALAQYDGANANLVFIGDGSDPFANYLVKVGAEVTVEANPVGSTFHKVYTGYVKSIFKDTDQNGLHRVTLVCGDLLQNCLSVYVESLTTTSATGSTYYDRWNAYKNVMPAFVQLEKATTTYAQFKTLDLDLIETTLQDSVNQTQEAEAGWLYANRDGWIYPVAHGYLLDTLANGTPEVYFSSTAVDHILAVSFVNQASDSTQIVNVLTAQLMGDALSAITITNQDSVDLYGKNSAEAEVDLYDDAQLQAWATYVSSVTGQQTIQALMLDAIDHRNMKLTDVYTLVPTSLVNVHITTNGLNIDENYLVARVRHSITPTTWDTELELWRQN